QPDEALAEAVGRDVRLVSGRALGLRRVGRPEIDMSDEALREDYAQRQVDLQAGGARAAPFLFVPRGQEHGQARREGDWGLAAADELETIVDRDVAHARAAVRR